MAAAGQQDGRDPTGFALVLKYIEIEGEFPRYGEQIPPAAVEFVAGLVKVDPMEFAKYSFANRTAKYHRSQIREALGFRPATVEDEQRWAAWLATDQCPVERDRGRLEAALRQRCRSEGVEPPTEGQIERVVISALNRHEMTFADQIVHRLGPQVCAALQALLESEGLLAEVKADPGPLGLDTLMSEIAKLTAVRALTLPQDIFADVSDRLVAAGRSRAARMFPSDSPRATNRCATHCSRRCAGYAKARSPTRWSGCWWTWCTGSTPARSAGWRRNCWATCPRCRARRASS
jgi:Domain of unknown function (DUF4158)